jgi:hypothetical protein
MVFQVAGMKGLTVKANKTNETKTKIQLNANSSFPQNNQPRKVKDIDKYICHSLFRQGKRAVFLKIIC